MSLSFYVEDDGKTQMVSCDDNKLVKDFILDYLKEYTNYVSLSTEDYTFEKGTKVLNDDRYLNMEIGKLVLPGSYITLIRKHDLKYSKNNIILKKLY